MKIPETVRIGFKDYKVTKVDGYVIDDNAVCYGNIEYDKDNINLSLNYSKDLINCTFIHECLHGIDNIEETELTEDQIRKIAKGLYSFVRDNPKIFTEGE